MGRPIKDGLDYMSIDCNMYNNRKIRLFRSEFSLSEQPKAFGILVLLIAHIYSGKGYYCPWDEDEMILFCDNNKLEREDVEAVVKAAVKRSFFDPERYQKREVLTSAEITSRFASAKDSRYSGGIDTEIGIVHGETLIDQGTISISHWKSAQSKAKKKEPGIVHRKTPIVHGEIKQTDSSKTCLNGHRYIGDFCDECKKIEIAKARAEQEDEPVF